MSFYTLLYFSHLCLPLNNQFSLSVMSDSLWPHGRMAGFPVHHQLLELTQTHVLHVGEAIQPSHPLSFPFSSHLHSFPASGSFPMNWFFPSGGQRIGFSASASVLPMNIRDLFPLGWTGLISLQSKGLSRVFSNNVVHFYITHLFKIIFTKNEQKSSLLTLFVPWSKIMAILQKKSIHENILPYWSLFFPSLECIDKSYQVTDIQLILNLILIFLRVEWMLTLIAFNLLQCTCSEIRKLDYWSL